MIKNILLQALNVVKVVQDQILMNLGFWNVQIGLLEAEIQKNVDFPVL